MESHTKGDDAGLAHTGRKPFARSTATPGLSKGET